MKEISSNHNIQNLHPNQAQLRIETYFPLLLIKLILFHTQVDTAHTKQVSFNKKNEESIYVPGSRIKASPASTNFPKLSPSVSILKKAVSTWNLEPPEVRN